MSRRAALTPEQARELRKRYAMFTANKPAKLAAEFGISDTAVRDYGTGKHKTRGLRPEDHV